MFESFAYNDKSSIQYHGSQLTDKVMGPGLRVVRTDRRFDVLVGREAAVEGLGRLCLAIALRGLISSSRRQSLGGDGRFIGGHKTALGLGQQSSRGGPG